MFETHNYIYNVMWMKSESNRESERERVRGKDKGNKSIFAENVFSDIFA